MEWISAQTDRCMVAQVHHNIAIWKMTISKLESKDRSSLTGTTMMSRRWLIAASVQFDDISKNNGEFGRF